MKILFVCLSLFSLLHTIAAESNVVVLTDANFDSVTNGDKSVLVEFYAPWCGHCKMLAPTYEEVADELKGNDDIVIAKVDATAESAVASKHEVQGYPTIILFKKGGGKQEYEGARDKAALVAFAKGEKPPAEEEEDTDVVVLTDENFDEVMQNPEKDVFVEFYAPWCGHCKNLAPTWAELATYVKGKEQYVIAKVDATAETKVATKYDVKGFPTIKMFRKDNKEGENYDGGRSIEDLVFYVTGEEMPDDTPDGPVKVVKDRNFEEIVLDETKHVLVEFYAPWCGHCKKLEPVWETLALAYDNEPDVVIAKLDATKYSTSSGKYNVKGFPTIYWFPKDNKDGIEYQGGRDDAKSFIGFINEKTGLEWDIGGKLKPGAGRCKVLDQVVVGLDDEEGDVSGLIPKIQLVVDALKDHKQGKNAQVYLDLVKGKVKDTAFIRNEDQRLDDVLEAEGSTSDDRRAARFGVQALGAFKGVAGMRAKALRAFARDNGIDTKDIMEASELRRVIKSSIPDAAKRLELADKALEDAKAMLQKEQDAIEERKKRKEEMKKKEEERRAKKASGGSTKVVKLTDYNFKKIVNDANKEVFVEFYAPWCGHCKQLAPVLEEVAVELAGDSDFSDVVVGALDATYYKKSADKFEVKSFPTLRYFPKDDKEGKAYKGGRTKDALLKFLKSHGEEVEGDAGDADDAEDDDDDDTEEEGPVKKLTKKNWDEVVNDQNTVLVEFYAPWCGHCKQLAPIYEEVAEELKDKENIVIAKVDATKSRSLSSKYGVQGFPTMKLFTPTDKTGDLEYAGGRTKKEIVAYVLSGGAEADDDEEEEEQDPNSDVVVLTKKNWDEIVKDNTKDVLVEFYAPWCGHCKNLAPTYEEVATAVKGKPIVIGKMDATKKSYGKIVKKFGVRGFPTMKWFPKDDKSGQDYEGGRSKSDILSFVTKNLKEDNDRDEL
eukprot:TRINITY_DN67080_c6_g11_i2.p1 TRINITY_DN67080_c6_g11~~TRINITY_DN67080_c6_g11_i2.p1  ORF type:complete len:951 (-),score=276.40 TRINITY_DN67080_c6_g11_i2:310-3135(-)